MSDDSIAGRLVQVKLALAQKYERQARVARSVPKRQKFIHRAEKLRRQAEQLSRQ
jgi:hypothetical protein